MNIKIWEIGNSLENTAQGYLLCVQLEDEKGYKIKKTSKYNYMLKDLVLEVIEEYQHNKY